MISHHSQSGFSLVETLVAITILLLVIVGPMSISSSAARSTNYSSEQVVAFFLAQEGAELAQKARDDLQLQYFASPRGTNTPWNDFASSGLYNECFTTRGCGLELVYGNNNGVLRSPLDCGSDPCRLYINDAGGRVRYTYTSTGASTTPYTRILYMDETETGREVEVTSRVTWQTGNQRQLQSIEVKTYLFNVYNN